jgi:hypothetical protein
MTEQQTALRIKALEQALQTVIHDLRVPEKLRSMRIKSLEQALRTVIHDLRIAEKLGSASAAYHQEQRDRSSVEIGVVRGGQTESARLPKTIRSEFAWACQGNCSQNITEEHRRILSCECISMEREIRISLWHNDESDDWSIKINGQHHHHITSEIMEGLVECALIVAQTSLTRALAQKPK